MSLYSLQHQKPLIKPVETIWTIARPNSTAMPVVTYKLPFQDSAAVMYCKSLKQEGVASNSKNHKQSQVFTLRIAAEDSSALPVAMLKIPHTLAHFTSEHAVLSTVCIPFFKAPATLTEKQESFFFVCPLTLPLRTP